MPFVSASMEFLFIFRSRKLQNKRLRRKKKWEVSWIITDQTDTFNGNCATMAARNSTASRKKSGFVHAAALLWKWSNNNNYWKRYFMSLFHLISLSFFDVLLVYRGSFSGLCSGLCVTYGTELLFNNDVIQLASKSFG